MKLNTPNKITILRILLLPIFMFVYLSGFIPYNKLISALIFIIAVSTDFIDGHIARKTNQITTLGKFLDPIADKLITTAALILIAVDNIIPSPYGVIIITVIICRELVIGGIRQVAASKNIIMAADKWGKIKMISQSLAIPLLLINSDLLALNLNHSIYMTYRYVSIILIGISAILTLYSGINYIYKNKNIFD